MQDSRSKELFEKSGQVIPGGVNSPVRAYRAVGRNPLFIEKASGAYITDVDGNSYIDYIGSWGPMILGHAYPSVIEKVREVALSGLSFGAPTQNEYILAQMITEAMPAIQKVRLVSSGTEAVMSALRLARGYTGRDYIIKFSGCYHGHVDAMLVRAGSGVMTASVSDSAGVGVSQAEHTLLARYNNIESVEALFHTYREKIAAVIIEPVAANMGVIPPKAGFLQGIREITKQYGALLIFDEVITGFRLCYGGACAYYGIEPDLVTLGKIVGGGMPLAAYGGRSDIMDFVAPLGNVYQAGTLSGNPLATAAGIETLRILKANPQIYETIDMYAAMLASAIEEIYNTTQKCVHVNRESSLLCTFFTNMDVTDYESAKSSDTKCYATYFSHLLEHGIYIAPSQFEAMFVSAAHTKEDIDHTIDVMRCISF